MNRLYKNLWVFFSLMGLVLTSVTISGCQAVKQGVNQKSRDVTSTSRKQATYLGRTPVISLNDTLHVLDYTFGDGVPKTLFTITPVKVVEDSRCPVNARCIQAGQFVVELRLSQHGTSEVIQVSTDSVKKTVWQGYEFTVDTVMPVAQTNQTILPMDYKMQLAVEKMN